MSKIRDEQILRLKLENNLCFGCTPFFHFYCLINNIDVQMM